MMDEYLTPADIAKFLHVCRSTVSNLTKPDKRTGKTVLPCIRIGKSVRVLKADLEAYLATIKTNPV